MSKYRFKTEREFKKDEEWNYQYNIPEGWNTDGDMNKYLGQDVPDRYIDEIECGKDVQMDGWHFKNDDIVENTVKKHKHEHAAATQNAAAYILIRRKTIS